MELSTTIIGLLILAIFVLPVILIARSGKGKSKRFEKEFFSETSRNALKISEKDFWNSYALGIDISQNKIMHVNWDGAERIVTIFSLNDIKNVESYPVQSVINKKDFDFKKAEGLSLRISFKDPSRKDINIAFFIPGFGQISDKEIKLFEKWSKIIRKVTDSKFDNIKHSA